MGDINNPTTYADWYWSRSVQATQARAEEIEDALKPITSELISNIPEYDKLPNHYKNYLQNIANPPKPSWENPLIRYVSQLGNVILERITGHEMKAYDYHMNSYLQSDLITPDIANVLKFRNKISDELWTKRQNAGGFSDIEGSFIYESQKPYPNLTDIISYCRYNFDAINPKGKVWDYLDISPNDWDIWDWVSHVQPTLDQTLTYYKRNYWDKSRTDLELARMGYTTEYHEALRHLAYSIPDASILLQAGLFTDKQLLDIIQDLKKADIHPDYTTNYIDAMMLKPDVTTVIEYLLRNDPYLNNLNTELRRIGIHPNYYDMYKTLAYPIPPVQDIITMAVREAFTPEIANRFGQYEDLPKDFITYAGKKGISKEWAERYWASHWSLPSPQQGFEMLHRGIINRDELNLLLRALDIMPFWRDKLIQVAYKPLTRVDVRRMYDLGTLNRDGVLKAYKDVGYDNTNAQLMTDFTVRYVDRQRSGLKANDIVTAYKNSLLNQSKAKQLLADINITGKEADNLLKTSEYKREWDLKTQQINAIENQFKKQYITQDEAKTRLSNLYLPSDYIDANLKQWAAKSEDVKEATLTNAQTLSYLKSGVITEERARQELNLLGYNQERIDIYIKATKAQKA
jgi:hypothetical protein